MSESNKRPASKADLAADTHIEKGREAVGSSVSLAIAAPVCVEEDGLVAVANSSSSSTTFKRLKEMMKYCKDDGHLIRMAVDGARKLQPIVVLKYNLAWLVANPEGQAQIRGFFLKHECTDTRNTGFVFHFRRYADLANCQKAMCAKMPDLFAFSPTTISKFNLTEPLRVGELWIVDKIGPNKAYSTMYKQFFWV